MVRKYEPEIEEEWYDYEPHPYRVAKMLESKEGEWVKLETYLNETNRLNKQIVKLKAIIKALEG